MIIGISGGTGSGKTTVAQKLMSALGESAAVCLQQDCYYRDLNAMPLDDRRQVNFDHPDSIDGELLLRHLEDLRAGRSVERPVYDFDTHSRRASTVHVEPLPVILVEGILIFHEERMRKSMDLKIFVDCDADIRFTRRLKRDMEERGRSVESVIEQYLSTVRPMHLQFVVPTIRYADIIVPGGEFNEAAIDLITARLREVAAARMAASESQRD